MFEEKEDFASIIPISSAMEAKILLKISTSMIFIKIVLI